MDKRGDWMIDSAPFMAIFVIIVAMLFLLFLVLVNMHASTLYEIPAKTEDTLLTGRFLQSCFAKEDWLSGTSISVIDWNKFDQAHLDDCYSILPNSKYYSFKLKLMEDKTQAEKSVQTSNWQGKSQYLRIQPVQIWREEEIRDGRLSIEVQPNE